MTSVGTDTTSSVWDTDPIGKACEDLKKLQREFSQAPTRENLRKMLDQKNSLIMQFAAEYRLDPHAPDAEAPENYKWGVGTILKETRSLICENIHRLNKTKGVRQKLTSILHKASQLLPFRNICQRIHRKFFGSSRQHNPEPNCLNNFPDGVANSDRINSVTIHKQVAAQNCRYTS